MARTGRPPKLDEARTARMVELIERGVPSVTAARSAGISESTFHRWMNRGAEDLEAGEESDYSEFRESIEAARAEAETMYTLLVTRAAQEGDTRAAIFWLTHSSTRDNWRDRTDINIDGGSVRVELEWPD